MNEDKMAKSRKNKEFKVIFLKESREFEAIFGSYVVLF
jgi:hypothetical protein